MKPKPQGWSPLPFSCPCQAAGFLSLGRMRPASGLSLSCPGPNEKLSSRVLWGTCRCYGSYVMEDQEQISRTPNKGRGVKSGKTTKGRQDRKDKIWPPEFQGSRSSRPHSLGPFFLHPGPPGHPPTPSPKSHPTRGEGLWERTSRATSKPVQLNSHVQGIDILRPRQWRRSTPDPSCNA